MLQIGVGFDGDKERLLVLGVAAGLPAAALNPEVSVIDLHQAVELLDSSRLVMACITLYLRHHPVR